MVAQRKFQQAQDQAALPAARSWEAMQDPLHPMHQELLRRFSQTDDLQEGLSRPARFAFIFYAAVLTWVALGAAAYAIYALV